MEPDKLPRDIILNFQQKHVNPYIINIMLVKEIIWCYDIMFPLEIIFLTETCVTQKDIQEVSELRLSYIFKSIR